VKASGALAPALRDAARLVARVGAGESLRETRRAALLDLTHGTLRRYGRVQAIVSALSSSDRADALVEALLWCSLYALESGRYAEYTVVDQAVKACGLLERWSAKGYVNALLRGFLRRRVSLERRLQNDLQARYQHPAWWIERLRADCPSQWESVLCHGNTAPPMCLRVNRRRTSAERYAARLAGLGMATRRLAGDALLLAQPVSFDELPGFAEGEVSVQDAGAQRAAACLDLAAGQRILDACAAPGGKSAHILESAAVDLIALDIDPARSARLAGNLERLGLRARIEVADVLQFASTWRGAPFERILADVPCSASGVARRHPDIKWLRRERDIARFASRQASFLDALWRLLAPGGKLLYATCSVFVQENDAVIDAFVARAVHAERVALPDAGASQWLPCAEHDGFYYALIEKKA